MSVHIYKDIVPIPGIQSNIYGSDNYVAQWQPRFALLTTHSSTRMTTNTSSTITSRITSILQRQLAPHKPESLRTLTCLLSRYDPPLLINSRILSGVQDNRCALCGVRRRQVQEVVRVGVVYPTDPKGNCQPLSSPSSCILSFQANKEQRSRMRERENETRTGRVADHSHPP